MAITIISNLTSGKYYPSQNPINVTVDSNNSGKCNFRYILDLYVNGTKVFTDKLFPDPSTGYGFFQMSRVIQDYIKTTIPKVSPASNLLSAVEASVPAAAFSIYFRFGEEYDSSTSCDGTIVQYTNLATSATSYVFEGAIDYEDFPTFDYTDYLVGTYSNNTTMFLTNSPREIEVTYNDMYSLDFISNTSYSSNQGARITVYKTDGTTSTSYIMSSALAQKRRFRLFCGPFDLNKNAGIPLISPLVYKYTVELIHTYQVGISTIRVNVSEQFTFKVKDPKPFRTRIGFVGLLGGLENFTFYHRNRKSYAIERKQFSKTLQSNYGGQWRYEVGDRGDSVYGVSAQQQNVVASYTTKEVSEWLYEMWLSPNVWTYKRPDLYIFRAFQLGSEVMFWVEDGHNLQVGDNIYCFTDNVDFVDTFTVASISGNVVDCNLPYSVYGATMEGTCGWVQKEEDWQILPVVISDNVIEVKERTGRPIEYQLNYKTSYQKTTLRG